jgi:hypothetical protein
VGGARESQGELIPARYKSIMSALRFFRGLAKALAWKLAVTFGRLGAG